MGSLGCLRVWRANKRPKKALSLSQFRGRLRGAFPLSLQTQSHWLYRQPSLRFPFTIGRVTLQLAGVCMLNITAKDSTPVEEVTLQEARRFSGRGTEYLRSRRHAPLGSLSRWWRSGWIVTPKVCFRTGGCLSEALAVPSHMAISGSPLTFFPSLGLHSKFTLRLVSSPRHFFETTSSLSAVLSLLLSSC